MTATPTTPDPREALRELVRYVERNTCLHEETHRAGFIWTICDGCGRKWADDEGGFQPDDEPAELVAARAALAQPAPVRGDWPVIRTDTAGIQWVERSEAERRLAAPVRGGEDVLTALLRTAPEGEPATAVRSIADRITVAVNNPASHGGSSGVRDFVRSECGRLHRIADRLATPAPAVEGGESARVALGLPAKLNDAAWLAAPAVEEDAEEDAYVIEQMGRLLAEIAVIVNGPEPANGRWSYHDLPKKVARLKQTTHRASCCGVNEGELHRPDCSRLAAPAGDGAVACWIGPRSLEAVRSGRDSADVFPTDADGGGRVPLFTAPPAGRVPEGFVLVPKLPTIEMLKCLRRGGEFPDDWELGKQMQREHGFDVVPPETNIEIAAGQYTRLLSLATRPDAAQEDQA